MGSFRRRAPVVAAVAAGGVLGAEARYALTLMQGDAATFPWATFVINVAGCVSIGVLMVVLLDLTSPHRLARPFLGVGVLGGFTTFSTYAVDIQTMLVGGRPLAALGYLALTPVAALAGRRCHPCADPPPQRRGLMTLQGRARQLTIVVGEEDTWHGRPLYTEIVHRAHAAGLAGASVFRGIEGFGASNHIHTTRILSLSDDLPVSVVVVDVAAKVEAFVADVAPLVEEGLITLTDVEVVRYTGRGGPDDRPAHPS